MLGMILALRRRAEGLERELSIASSYADQLWCELVAAGAADPELGP